MESPINDGDYKFSIIKKVYDEYYNSLLAEGKKTFRSTGVGIWGQYPCECYFGIFRKIRLEKFKNFIDLGSGDGKVVMIASLFTNASGIEFDCELFNKSVEIKEKLCINCRLLHGDFFDIDLSRFDFIFITPDKGFHNKLEDKLIKEMHEDSVLFVCDNTFLPCALKKGKTEWFGQMPFIKYTK